MSFSVSETYHAIVLDNKKEVPRLMRSELCTMISKLFGELKGGNTAYSKSIWPMQERAHYCRRYRSKSLGASSPAIQPPVKRLPTILVSYRVLKKVCKSVSPKRFERPWVVVLPRLQLCEKILMNMRKDELYNLRNVKINSGSTRTQAIRLMIDTALKNGNSVECCLLAVAIMDNYNTRSGSQKDTRLIGLTSLLIASKLGDVLPLTIENIQPFSSFPPADIINKESEILDRLNYRLFYVTSADFLKLYTKFVKDQTLLFFDRRLKLAKRISLQGMTYLLMSLFNSGLFKYSASVLAVGALCMAITEFYLRGEFAGSSALVGIFKVLLRLEDNEAAVRKCTDDLIRMKLYFAQKYMFN